MTAHGGITGQGTGSVSIIDSHLNNVPKGITIPATGDLPSIVLDNLEVESSSVVVQDVNGKTIFAGTGGDLYVSSWSMGGAYLDQNGERQYLTGYLSPTPNKPTSLLDGTAKYFTQSKPLYQDVSPVVATDNGVSNGMGGDQTKNINTLLANNIGKVIFFPAGIYLVEGTVFVPMGSKIIGSGFSQIMATGSYFQDKTKPNVMVRVGNKGDEGVVEIQDFLFTVQGPTAGCILMEWNIAQSNQGSAAMWNSHFRVGGAEGTDLQVAQCQGAASGGKCDAATMMMMHITPGATGYFENVWAWVADHDLDNPGNAKAVETQQGIPVNADTNLNIYGGRASSLYNYQIQNASTLFFSHMQTESPYYQPKKSIGDFAYSPNSGGFSNDPTFSDCSQPNCLSAWALRVLSSKIILIYSTGFYSFFNDQQLGCGGQQNCQERLIQTNYVGELFYYNIFTYGATEIISPAGGVPPPIFFNDSNQNGYTSEVAAFLELADLSAQSLGSELGSGGGNGSGVVYINPTIWMEPQASRTVDCIPPCTFVLPPITLATPTTITFPPWTTTLEVGWTTTSAYTTTDSVGPATITTSFFTSIYETTVLTIPPVTTTEIPIWNVENKRNHDYNDIPDE
ncbi:uncharacterized protein RCC_05303 [Ramularia collo-cygni]|uniref:Glycoside hydrolase family 55 protein n=1 Tax=Ramularia collo-cygni TaxID=112498 RepID=A0A2D3UR08_9PEZI|nr:uncharacterized protein RCC_05303 [Ramularia collo-cygni]CZT19452.1 uncharacterized protein RCC_05303 [Ramularia collo-cygni]